MPKSGSAPKKVKRSLSEVKQSETEGLAARTAAAIERYQSSTVNDNSGNLDFYEEEPREEPGQLDQESSSREEDLDQGSSSLDSQALWARLNIDSSDLLVFTRGEWEVITIRLSPTGEGWIINYSEPEESGPT